MSERFMLRIACPEIKYPDFYGVDMPVTTNYLRIKEVKMLTIKKYIGSDS